VSHHHGATAGRSGPPLWHAAVLVPLALALAVLSPVLIGGSGLGAAAPWVRLVAQALAFACALGGWYQADQAEVRPSVHDENLRVVLILGGLLAAMYSVALGWLAVMEVLGALLA
jgi:hypothetical protein